MLDIAPATRTAGAFGLTGVVLSLTSLPLWFLQEVPSDSVILLRILLSLLGCTAFLVFFPAWGQVVRDTNPTLAPVATTVVASGVLWIGLTFVHLSMEGWHRHSNDDAS